MFLSKYRKLRTFGNPYDKIKLLSNGKKEEKKVKLKCGCCSNEEKKGQPFLLPVKTPDAAFYQCMKG